MYRIGEFAMLSKTTVKALRYYEEQGLIKPSFVDRFTGYRYYETKQLEEIALIVSLREIGLSIKEIKIILCGGDILKILEERKNAINTDVNILNNQLLKIDELLKEKKSMKQEIIIKNIPSYTVYYKEGIVKDFSETTSLVLSSAEECMQLNPNIKCVTPDYCFISYPDGECTETNIKIRYSQAVESVGNESDTIKFATIPPIKAVCIEHKGSYANLRETYNIAMKYIEEKGYKLTESPREQYINGCWNKDKEEDYLTEIQFPIE